MVANNAIGIILPLLIVAVSAGVVLVVDLFTMRKGILAWIAAAGLMTALGAALAQWGALAGVAAFGCRRPELGFAGMVSLDTYALYAIVLFCLIGVVTILLSDAYLARRSAPRGEFYTLLLLIIVGMIGMAQSADLLAFFISFELMSLPTYVLAGYLWRNARSGEASIKYFITGAFASAILLFGLALLYAATGQTGYGGIADGLVQLGGEAHALVVAALVLVVTGFGFKVGAVPFHSWVPDVYEGAPTPVTAFMSVGVKAAAFIGFAKLFLVALQPQAQTWVNALIVLAVLTMVVGNVLALPQRNLKRMLAYSSIAHAGYLSLGLIAAGLVGDVDGLRAVLFYLAAYAFMNLGAFGALVWIRNRRRFGYTLDEVGGLARTMPWTSLLITLLMLSLVGIPPTLGFWGKFTLFAAVVRADLVWLAVLAVVMSTVSAYYYLRVVWYLYFREAPEGHEVVPEPASSQLGVAVAVAITGLGVVLVGIFPQQLLELVQGAVRLFGG